MIKILFILFITFFSSLAYSVRFGQMSCASGPLCSANPMSTSAYESACQAYPAAGGWMEAINTGGSMYCIQHPNNWTLPGGGYDTSSCPANSTQDLYTCTCNSGFTESADHYSCVPPLPTCDSAGTKNSEFGKNYTMTGSPGDTVCIGQCSYYTTDSIEAAGTSLVGVGRSAGTANCTTAAGLSSVPPVTPSTPPSPTSCMAQGKSYITMNSVTQCVGAGTPGATPVTVTQSQQTAVSGVPGTTTVKDTYTQEGEAITRTRVETPSSGGSPVVTTTTAPASQFCETNPEASVCKEKKGSASGGESCTSPPACDGDAILCAQLQQTWTARCESQTTSDIRTLGENVLGGNDTLANKPDPNDPTVVPVGTLNTTEIFTGATCPAPVPMNFSVMGVSHSMSFDLTPFCTLGGVIGLLNVLASLFAAGRIIAGGI